MSALVRFLLGVALAFLSTFGAAAPAGFTLEQVTLLAVGPTDGRAVLRMPNKSLLELRIGDKLPGTAALLVRVTADLAVFEDHPDAKQAPQTVWLRLHGRAERLRLVPDAMPADAASPMVARIPLTTSQPASPARAPTAKP